MRICIVTFIYVVSLSIFAQTEIYKDTDNTGLNKKERIDSIEKYLIDLSKSIKGLESRLDENSKKLKNLDDILKLMKVQDSANALKNVGEKEEIKYSNPEVAKLKTELESLKSADIEKLKKDVIGLTDAMKSIQLILKSQKY